MSDEELRQLQAAAQMQEAAVIEAGTRDVGKDPFMDAYGTIAAKLGPDGMRAFNDAALAHDNVGKIYTDYAADPARLDRVAKLPYGRAVVDMGRVESGVAMHTSHEPAWQTLAKSPNKILSDEDWAGGKGDFHDLATRIEIN
jgi:hypothetical protein